MEDVVIIDYATSNLRSVCNALDRLGARWRLSSDAGEISAAERVLLPGVGDASCAMNELKARGLDDVVRGLTVPVLGICVGMQLLCRSSEEGNVNCLGIFNTPVCRLQPDAATGVKVPHMGWNTLTCLTSPLFEGLEEGCFAYFVHSYAASLCPETIAVAQNGISFSAALSRENFYGVQFHPEKSGEVGSRILYNFLNIK